MDRDKMARERILQDAGRLLEDIDDVEDPVDRERLRKATYNVLRVTLSIEAEENS